MAIVKSQPFIPKMVVSQADKESTMTSQSIERFNAIAVKHGSIELLKSVQLAITRSKRAHFMLTK